MNNMNQFAIPPDCNDIQWTLHRGHESYDVCAVYESDDGSGGDIYTKQELNGLPDRFIMRRVSSGHTDQIKIFPSPLFAIAPEYYEVSCLSYPFSRF
jgi:hypothetical protein